MTLGAEWLEDLYWAIGLVAFVGLAMWLLAERRRKRPTD